jgi:hypothetical protein
MRLLDVANRQLSPSNVLDMIERATSQGVLSPEAVMLCAKLCTITRADCAIADRSDEALKQLHSSVEAVLRDPAAHGYSPTDYRLRLGSLSRTVEKPESVPAFIASDLDECSAASLIAASIVAQSNELNIGATGSIRFLTQRAATLANSVDDTGVAALALAISHLPQAPATSEDEPTLLQIAAASFRAALTDTKCLMPLIKRVGQNATCEHALAIVSALPSVAITPLAEQYMMSGAMGLRRTLDMRLRAMPVAGVVELAQALVQHSGVTPHLLALLENLDLSRAHATMVAVLKETPAPQRKQVLESLVKTGAPIPAGMVATALVDEDMQVVALGAQHLLLLPSSDAVFAIHAAFTHLDGAKKLSIGRTEFLAKAAEALPPHGPQALASLLSAWRWTLTGHRPCACSIIAQHIRVAASQDEAVAQVLHSWSHSSGRLVEWLMPHSETP